MNRWAWILLIALSTVGLVVVIQSSLQPKNVKLISPSYFDSTDAIADLLWDRYRELFMREPHFIIGIAPGSAVHEKIAQRLYERAGESGLKFSVHSREARLATDTWSAVNEWPGVDLRNGVELFAQNFSAVSGFYLMPNFFTSHVIGDTPMIKLEKQLARKILTLSFVDFVLSMEDFGKLNPACDGRAVLGDRSVSALGCAAKRKSLESLRKKLDRGRHVMALEQTGEKDYLVYLWTPSVK